MSVFEWTSIIAIVVGPTVAVIISIWINKRNEDRRRKYQILSDLMRTRGARLDPAHYSAINLIETEFYGREAIISSHSRYIELLSSYPSREEDTPAHQSLVDAQFSDLLQKVGRELGYKFDKSDLERRAYFPRGVGNLQLDMADNAFQLRRLLRGQIALPVAMTSNAPEQQKEIPDRTSDLSVNTFDDKPRITTEHPRAP